MSGRAGTLTESGGGERPRTRRAARPSGMLDAPRAGGMVWWLGAAVDEGDVGGEGGLAGEPLAWAECGTLLE